MNCRGCGTKLHRDDALCDLGALPLANALLTEDGLGEPEIHYPIRPLICRECLLVQLPGLPRESIFTDAYPFHSGQSAAWVKHCEEFAAYARRKYHLTGASVLEIGSNDGTMLQAFRDEGIEAVGYEPCAAVAIMSEAEGLPTVEEFWGVETAERWRGSRDLIVANNVLAHVPDLQDFLCGVRIALAPDGIASFEVAYLGALVESCQFDQIYAEHYSYFCLGSIHAALRLAGLKMLDALFIPTHGGSVRVTTARWDSMEHPVPERTKAMLLRERRRFWYGLEPLKAFSVRPPASKVNILRRLTACTGRTVGYGASAKCAALLNYCGVGPEMVRFIADTTPAKQGKYLPGVRIPIVHPDELAAFGPDHVVNFCWNWREESEANIRAAWPNARIVYLAEGMSPKVAVAA